MGRDIGPGIGIGPPAGGIWAKAAGVTAKSIDAAAVSP